MIGDEMLTPDSSRFWPADGYEPGHGQPSFDKQDVYKRQACYNAMGESASLFPCTVFDF